MDIESLTMWLSGNPSLNLLFLFLAIAGIIISVTLYFISRKSKEPRYFYKSFPIIENHISAIDGLDIRYKDNNIKRLTISKLSIWNGGRETIDGSDIAPKDKLRLSLDQGIDLISIKPILEKRTANNITALIEDGVAYIYFDFLDHGDGAIFEIFHTGSKNTSVTVEGTIKGVRKIKIGQHDDDYIAKNFLKFLIGWMSMPIFNKYKVVKILLVTIFAPISFIIFFPILMILNPLDALYSLFYKAPKDYDLSSIDSLKKSLKSVD